MTKLFIVDVPQILQPSHYYDGRSNRARTESESTISSEVNRDFEVHCIVIIIVELAHE
jgi:hypothetical protein